MSFICFSEEYYIEAYKRIYDNFVFSLRVYGSHPVLRRRLVRSSLERCDEITERFRKSSIFTNRLSNRCKQMILDTYFNTTGERFHVRSLK